MVMKLIIFKAQAADFQGKRARHAVPSGSIGRAGRPWMKHLPDDCVCSPAYLLSITHTPFQSVGGLAMRWSQRSM